jgi:hypothetical protein
MVSASKRLCGLCGPSDARLRARTRPHLGILPQKAFPIRMLVAKVHGRCVKEKLFRDELMHGCRPPDKAKLGDPKGGAWPHGCTGSRKMAFFEENGCLEPTAGSNTRSATQIKPHHDVLVVVAEALAEDVDAASRAVAEAGAHQEVETPRRLVAKKPDG